MSALYFAARIRSLEAAQSHAQSKFNIVWLILDVGGEISGFRQAIDHQAPMFDIVPTKLPLETGQLAVHIRCSSQHVADHVEAGSLLQISGIFTNREGVAEDRKIVFFQNMPENANAHFVRVMEEVQPLLVFLKNVAGNREDKTNA